MTMAAEARGTVWFEALKEAAITAAVSAALMLPLIALHARTQATGLVIETRFVIAALAVLLVFLGRAARRAPRNRAAPVRRSCIGTAPGSGRR